MAPKTAVRSPATGTNTPSRHHRSLTDAIAIVLSLFGLYGFAHSFFLAKRTLPRQSACNEAATLLQDVLGLTEQETLQLQERGLVSDASKSVRQGCWMDRSVDSMVVLVVDALRFDFALYNLPESIGRRLPSTGSSATAGTDRNFNSTRSRLFQFVADPPTVTMQRLKALTTGGLPTFADISANFGGAEIEEDTWVQQLLGPTTSIEFGTNNNIDNWRARGLSHSTRA